MTILNRNIYPEANPYVRFYVDENLSSQEILTLSGSRLFCELPEDLLGTYCHLTRSYVPFALYDETVLKNPNEIYAMAANFAIWEFQLLRTPENYFQDEANFWAPSDQVSYEGKFSVASFKADLIETLNFIIGEMNASAKDNKRIIIKGI